MPFIGGIYVPDVKERPGFGDILSSAAQGAYGQVRYGLPYQAQKLAGNISAEDEAFYQQKLAETSAASSAAAPAGVSDLTSGKVGIARFIGENLVSSLPYMVGGVAGALGGAAVGGVPGAIAGAVVGGTPQFSASNVARNVEEQGGLSEAGAARSLAVAPFQSAADAAIGRFLPGAGKVIGGAAASQVGGFLARTGKSIAKAGATEAATEALQQVGERYAAGIDVTGADAAGEYVNAAVTAFAVGGVLGAGGGFRRRNAHAKPVGAVTNDDMLESINEALGLSLPAPESRLALPAPGQGVAIRPENDLRRTDIVTDQFGRSVENVPDFVRQLGATNPADFVVDSAGRAVPGSEGADALATSAGADPAEVNVPSGVDLAREAEIVGSEPGRLQRAWRDAQAALRPQVPAALAAPSSFDPAAAVDALAGSGSTSPLALERSGEFNGLASRPDVPASPRVFADQPFDELVTAAAAKKAEPALRAEAQAEIESRYAEAAGTAPLTTDNFKDRLAEVKNGLRGSFITKLDATSPTDLREKVYERLFVDNDSASSVQKLGQRIGLLDENLEPTPAVAEIEAARTAATQAELAAPPAPPPAPPAQVINQPVTPAAPADPAFAAQWNQLKSTAGIERESKNLPETLKATPSNETEARITVFRELANDPVGRGNEPTQTEKLARKMGLITDDDNMDITPLGRKTYLASSEGNEETLSAARDQGYGGALASAFDRGARATVTGVETGNYTAVEDATAYEAGKVWAQKFIDTPGVATGAVSNAITYRKGSRKAKGSTPLEEGGTGQPRATVDPKAVQRQALNKMLGTMDLTGVNDADVLVLKRSIAAGSVDATQLAQAVQKLQGGGTLRQAPVPRAPTPLPVRGQPIFKEINTDDPSSPKADQRAQSEAAVRAFDLRNLVEFARAEGGISDARAQKLHDLLDQGNVDQVKRLLKDFDPDAATPTSRRLPKTPERVGDKAQDGIWTGRTDEALEAELAGKTFLEAADVLIEKAPSRYYREIMRKVKGLAQSLEKTGAKLDMQIIVPGDTVPARLNDPEIQGWTYTKYQPLEVKVWLKGKAMGPAYGVSPQVLAHEMLHAVTSGLLASNTDPNSRVGKAKQDLHDLANTVIEHYNAKMRAGTMNDFEQAVYDRQINALASRNEILAWGLTNPDMQRYLQSIEYQPRQSVFAKLVDLLRSLLGIDGKYETALTELLRVSEQILGARGADLQATTAPREAQADAQVSRADDTSDLDRVLNSRYIEPTEYLPLPDMPPLPQTNTPPPTGLASGRGMDERELARYQKQFWRGKADLPSSFEVNDQDGIGEAMAVRYVPDAQSSEANRTVQATNETTMDIAARAGSFIDGVKTSDFAGAARRKVFGLVTHNHLVREYANVAPWLVDHDAAHRSRAAVRGRWENIGDGAHQQWEALKRDKPKVAEQVNDLMSDATEFQLDPFRAFEDHDHLKGSKNAGALKRKHAELVKLKNDLSRGDGAGIKMFNEFRVLNEAQNFTRLVGSLHSMISMDPELKAGIAQSDVNPMDEFMLQPDIVSSSQLRGWWEQKLQHRLAAATAFINAKQGEVVTANASEQAATRMQLSPLAMKIAATHEALAGMAKAPYFHLGRFGEHFGSATIRTNADGTVDLAAQQHVAEALAKAGFNDVQISPDNTRPKISMRFETKAQRLMFERVATELQRQNWLSSDPIQAGKRDRSNNYGTGDSLPAFVNDYIQRIESSPAFVPAEDASKAERAALAKQKDDAIRLAVETHLESQPDNSIHKVLAKRYTVAGFNRDMARNWAHRWSVGSTSIAAQSAAPKFTASYVAARGAINSARDVTGRELDRQRAAEKGESYTAPDPDLQVDLLDEVMQRDTSDPFAEPSNWLDATRATSHAYFLGMSPAYALINMTQMGVVALPELAKQHGYTKSFHAMRRASAVAWKVVKASLSEARTKGWANLADLTLSEAVLQKAGLTKSQLDFARHMLATGSIDIGTSALALGQFAKSGDQSTAGRAGQIGLKYAGALGLYSETFSRLTVALAAHEMHGGSVAESAAYATNVVSNSMFDYQNWNTARYLGKRGLLGPVTPIVTQFMSYSVQMTEKLYSEFHGAVGSPRPGESAKATAARKAESWRFIRGHLTAVGALAGTLGLPFATVIAGSLEKLVDQFDDDDDPFDATASYRGFLADVLGKDIAEVVARGLPRAVGFDISARAGEQNLLPFSEFYADRRPWKDALENSAGRSLGAVPSMFSNIFTGGGKIADGDLLGGMKDVLPVALKGPIETYRMTEQGYVDSKGTKLPMTPGASAIMWQLLGFSPSEKAEYAEARGDQAARRGLITREANTLRKRIVSAVTSGDSAKARELITQAQAFDQDNPAFAIIPSLAGSIQRQQTTAMQARATRSPIGVSMRDIAGQSLTSYANVDY